VGVVFRCQSKLIEQGGAGPRVNKQDIEKHLIPAEKIEMMYKGDYRPSCNFFNRTEGPFVGEYWWIGAHEEETK
jgi:hypothetical protein